MYNVKTGLITRPRGRSRRSEVYIHEVHIHRIFCSGSSGSRSRSSSSSSSVVVAVVVVAAAVVVVAAVVVEIANICLVVSARINWGGSGAQLND